MTTSAFHPVVSSTVVIRLQRIDVRDNKIARIRGISPYHKHMATAAIPAPTYHQRFAIVNLPADDCSACGTIYPSNLCCGCPHLTRRASRQSINLRLHWRKKTSSFPISHTGIGKNCCLPDIRIRFSMSRPSTSYFVPVRKLAQKDIQKMRMQSSRMRVT